MLYCALCVCVVSDLGYFSQDNTGGCGIRCFLLVTQCVWKRPVLG